ncbi:Ubiquinone/menaquinone biosynthesis C-methyltransferase UbiE [Posidoniimonas polymericola]|uniref:Ubiquinone/menaquinone biosynthesis C-methyltransferase UbiE n=1 Tax=Posidoniimonas polymericola TaxID=2528002 RepID=A0A5C5XUX3_9BACT|nr:class I SAM-dependent methyltransferase [Posidoniimonas polymericola]TWT65392.1 Ubiquinone/menaquinone biosynthesis C-methyltransferase UbiE [Posidoniimonas polymericola]
MTALSQLKTLYHLTLSPIRGETHQERLDSFYSGQAEDYDEFRKRMLHGRDELFADLPAEPGASWVDMGSGTGMNAERFGARLENFGQVTLADLSESLLKVADKRIADRGWANVRTMHADITRLEIPDESVDLVTFTYSLTMVPDWFSALQEAYRILKPGGVIGVADFYISRKFPAEGLKRHSWFTRSLWPVWFSLDNVHPSADHVPYLMSRFEKVSIHEDYGKLPWVPVIKPPHYRFVGRKPA